MVEILFIRHGATAGNLEKRYIGRTDEPLSAIGEKQAHELKEKLRKEFADQSINRIFISPLLRTRQTAEILFPDAEYTVEPDLIETDFGIFEGKNADELSESSEYRAWLDSMCLAPIPGGESVTDFKARCCKAFLKIIKNVSDDSRIAFVIHGGVIMSILEAFAIPKRGFYDYNIKNCSIVLCECSNKNSQDSVQLKIKSKM